MTNNITNPILKEDKERVGIKENIKDLIDKRGKELKDISSEIVVKKRGKYKRYSKIDKLVIYKKSLELLSKGMNLAKVAISLSVPRKTIYDLLSQDELFAEYKKTQKQVLDIEYAKLAYQTVKEARKRLKAGEIVDFKDLVVSGAIAHDKIYPPLGIAQQFNVMGKDLSVEMPTFFKPRKTHSPDT